MLSESEITRKVTTPGGTRWLRDQETRDIVDGHTKCIGVIENDMADIKSALEYPDGTTTWFGWRRPLGSANTEGEPCGNLLRLARMKQILGLGGYMVKNDHSRRKLSASNHNFYEDDGAQVVFTGAHGHYHWGWGVPLYYGAWEEDGYEYEAFDDRVIPGKPCVRIPVGSVSAAGRCAIDRTNLVLVDYISETEQYRGGNGYAEWDGSYRSLLGMPVSKIPVTTLAAYARKNGNMWFSSERVAIFIVGALMRVFFHNASIGAGFQAGLDDRGLHRGGLGPGIDYDNTVHELTDNRGYNPYCKMSVGIDKGDFTGLLSTSLERSDGTVVTVGNIPCFMGLKNWYKSLWIMTEDELLVCNSDKTQSLYVKKVIDGTAPSMASTGDMVLVGRTPAHAGASWSAIRKISRRYLSGMPVEDGATYDTFVGDGYYNPAATAGSVRGALRLGGAYYGDLAGSLLLNGYNAPSYAYANGGAVLCEFTEAFDTELAVISE